MTEYLSGPTRLTSLMGRRTPTTGSSRSISRRSLALIDGSDETLLSGRNVPQAVNTMLSNDESKILLMARGMGLTRHKISDREPGKA
jgi:hypothetical protein